MGRIIVSENASVDGVVQDPTGEEGTRHGGWFTRVTDGDRAAWAAAARADAQAAQALLLGRRTYEFFAARWPSRTGPLADRLNAMPKYVVSSALHDPEWANSTVLTGPVAAQVAELKQGLYGDVLVYASFQLARALFRHGLVDEVRLTLYPWVLGAGERLLGDGADQVPLRLGQTRPLGHNLVVLTYAVGRDT